MAAPELAAIIADCEPRALFYGAAWRETAHALDAAGELTRVALDPATGRDYRALLAASRPAPPAAIGLEQVTTIRYTSGTTGRPNGVQIPWRQVVFNAVNTMLACHLGPDDAGLGFLPTFHVGGLHCVATPLLAAGGQVALMRTFDPEASVAALEAGEVTTAIAVPAMYRMLLDAGLGRRSVPRLRALLCGGAPLPVALLEAYHGAGLPLRQGYGLTEVGPNCFSLSPLEGPRRVGTVGVPTFHSQARLVDAEGREVPPDTPGELLLRGPHVTSGYWQNPAATRQVLDADGWFHTGDLLQRTADGYFSVVGRQKEMFISGGENVYPAEVQTCLASHPAVAEVAVVGVADARWGRVGLAAIVLRPEAAAADADGLRAWAAARIARYKVSRHWRLLSALPLNASGKVVKPALRELVA